MLNAEMSNKIQIEHGLAISKMKVIGDSENSLGRIEFRLEQFEKYLHI